MSPPSVGPHIRARTWRTTASPASCGSAARTAGSAARSARVPISGATSAYGVSRRMYPPAGP